VASLVDMNAAGAIDEARMQKTVDIVSGAYEMKSKVKAQDVFRSKL